MILFSATVRFGFRNNSICSLMVVMVERLFLAVPRGCLQFVIVVFPDHTHLLFFSGRKFLMESNKTKCWVVCL